MSILYRILRGLIHNNLFPKVQSQLRQIEQMEIQMLGNTVREPGLVSGQ